MTARIAAFSPGQSPPPVRIPSRCAIGCTSCGKCFDHPATGGTRHPEKYGASIGALLVEKAAIDAVSATDAALAELARLSERYGPLMLFQSGGRFDGSSALCVSKGELLVGPDDLLLGEVGGVPFYIDAEQYERWNRPSLLLDVAPGAAGTFSLEVLDDAHFVALTTGCRRDQRRTGQAGSRCHDGPERP